MQAVGVKPELRSVSALSGTDAPVLGSSCAETPGSLEPAAIRDLVRAAALRGSGGAGFPSATKLDAVAAAGTPTIAVLNAEEGEPASVKDRWLLQNRADLAVEGLQRAAAAVGADQAYVYLSDESLVNHVQDALSRVVTEPQVPVEIVTVAPAYVAGEETAVVRAIDGGPALPLPKPPRPYESGIQGRPTLVANAESMVRIALACRPEVGERAGQSLLATLTIGEHAVLREVPVGTSIREVLQAHPDFDESRARAIILGGYAGGIWRPESVLGLPASHDLRAHGTLWGCGAIMVVTDDECPVAAAADVLGYLADSSAQQCGSCTMGTAAFAAGVGALTTGHGDEEKLATVARRSKSLPGRGNCAMPDAASLVAATLLSEFAPEVEAHLNEGPCTFCAAGLPERSHGESRFRVSLPPTAIAVTPLTTSAEGEHEDAS